MNRILTPNVRWAGYDGRYVPKGIADPVMSSRRNRRRHDSPSPANPGKIPSPGNPPLEARSESVAVRDTFQGRLRARRKEAISRHPDPRGCLNLSHSGIYNS
jgi:hypothetical protein